MADKTRKFFHEYNEDFYRRPATGESTASRATTRKPMCDCGEDFLRFAKEYFPDLMSDPTPQELENALLTLTREYAYRKKFVIPHRLFYCLPDMFDELLTLLTDKLDELNRLPEQGFSANLYLGEDPTVQQQDTE